MLRDILHKRRNDADSVRDMHKLRKQVPVVQAYQGETQSRVAAVKPKFLFSQSDMFMAQRAGMIVATCLLAVFLVAYLLAILL